MSAPMTSESTQDAARAHGSSLQRMVRPRTITLSENVRQESPVGFMVFAHEDMDADYMTFGEERDAKDYAMEQEEKANAPEDSWPIYALWASEWPNVSDQRPGDRDATKNKSSDIAGFAASDG